MKNIANETFWLTNLDSYMRAHSNVYIDNNLKFSTFK